jgi:hypothetical protein
MALETGRLAEKCEKWLEHEDLALKNGEIHQ